MNTPAPPGGKEGNMPELSEEFKENVFRLTRMDLGKEELKGKETVFLFACNAKGEWELHPTLYLAEKKKGQVVLIPYRPKTDKKALKLKGELADKIIGKMDRKLKEAIGKEIKKALLEKPLLELEGMATVKGKVKMERKRGCFFIEDEEGRSFFL